MINREQKKELIDELAGILKNSKSIVFTSFDKIDVADQRELRKNLRDNQAGYKVFKKTLIRLALDQSGNKVNLDDVHGSIGLAYSQEDELVPIKTSVEFKKEHKDLQTFSCIIDNTTIGNEEIEKYATLPSKEVVEGQLVGTIAAPMTGFVNVLAGNMRGLINVLNAKAQEG